MVYKSSVVTQWLLGSLDPRCKRSADTQRGRNPAHVEIRFAALWGESLGVKETNLG